MDAIPVHQIDEENSTASPALPHLHIASFIVHVRSAAMGDVVAWLEQQPQIEIYTQSPEGKLAVVMECNHERKILDLLDALDQQPGVLSSAMIYHEMIDGEEDV